MAASMSAEEEEKAKAMLADEAGDDDFKDALEDEEVDGAGNFKVSQEELAIIRAELACEFPEDYNYLSDAYILSVASKPYSKDLTVRRPLEVSLELMLRLGSCLFASSSRWTPLTYLFSDRLHIVLHGKINPCNGMASPRRGPRYV
jgi:hypothetical protein